MSKELFRAVVPERVKITCFSPLGNSVQESAGMLTIVESTKPITDTQLYDAMLDAEHPIDSAMTPFTTPHEIKGAASVIYERAVAEHSPHSDHVTIQRKRVLCAIGSVTLGSTWRVANVIYVPGFIAIEEAKRQQESA